MLLKSRRILAQILYALLLVATAIWAYWEAGFDWWPLAARLGVLLLLAIPLLLPTRGEGRQGAVTLAIAWVAVGVFTVASIPYDAHRIEGKLNSEPAVQDPRLGNVTEGDWLSYGRSNFGQRYSPLEQITPENVSELELAWEYQTGDRKGPDDIGETTYEATPLKVGNTLYLCTLTTGWWPWTRTPERNAGSMMLKCRWKASASTRPAGAFPTSLPARRLVICQK